jgi:AhpD family alkylhydroperoxidase
MNNPAMVIGDAMKPILDLSNVVQKAIPPKLMHLIHLRISQINGCSVCVFGGTRAAQKEGETTDRLFAVGAWAHSPLFTDAERAALALAEAITRLPDRADPVPDAIWAEAARHYDERALSGLLLAIALVNVWNRLNVPTGQVAGAEWK